jgi:hypothetical protein
MRLEMKLFRIAGLVIAMEPKFPTLMAQSALYEMSKKEQEDFQRKPDIVIDLPMEFYEERQKENPHLTLNDCEYIWTGSEFYHQFIQHDGFLLHSSAVAVDNKAYLFSAPSGTGKSTHTGLWLQYFGEKAEIINDDKPAIRYIDGHFFAIGTPWSGKTALNANRSVPLQGIAFIERAKTNSIQPMPVQEGIIALMNQTLRPDDYSLMDRLLSLLDQLFQQIPVYRLACNMELEAVETSYNTMSQGEL